VAKHKDNKKLNACKFCGKVIPGSYERNPKAKVYCDKSCRDKKTASNKMAVECCVCGKPIERYRNALNVRDKFACSATCQRVVAGRAGKDWASRSKEARKRWVCRDRKARKERNPWWKVVGKKIDKAKCVKYDCSSWEYRVALRLECSTARKSRKFIQSRPSGSVLKALARIEYKRAYWRLDDWHKKAGYKLSSHKARRSRKSGPFNETTVEGWASGSQDQGKWQQMCFEWLGD